MDKFFDWLSCQAGKPRFIVASTVVIVTALLAGFLVDAVNIGISIASFVLSLMILGRQDRNELRDQARDKAMHAKLDELIHATSDARDELIHLEDREEAEIDAKRLD